MITIVLLLLVLLFSVFFVIAKELRPPNFPPGPSWWPFLGNGFMLRKLSIQLKGHHLALTRLYKEHNANILGLKLGRELVVVASSADVIRNVLTRDVFSGRPLSFFMKLRCFGKRQGITSTDGYVWREQRAFTVRQLKHLGYGKETMDFLILDEVRDLIQFFDKESTVQNISQTTAPSVLNVLWALATGKRLQKTDPSLTNLLKLLGSRAKAFDMAGGTLNQIPWIRFIAPKRSGYTLLQEINFELKKFLMASVMEHKDSYDPDQTRDLIDAFLHEQNAKAGRNSNFSDEQLIVLLLDLFLGGAQTTSRTLDFAFLLMIRYPEVQEKVYKNIIEVVGKDRIPTTEDKAKLAYVEAVLLEVMRIFYVVPIIGPRRALQDTTLNGFYIPKNTTILLNLYAVHYNEKTYPNPEEFRPERFVNSNGELTADPESLMVFGLGKRRCLGEALAKSCLFIIFAAVIQNFEISNPPDDDKPSLEPVSGLTLSPKPYSAQFKRR